MGTAYLIIGVLSNSRLVTPRPALYAPNPLILGFYYSISGNLRVLLENFRRAKEYESSAPVKTMISSLTSYCLGALNKPVIEMNIGRDRAEIKQNFKEDIQYPSTGGNITRC